MFCCIIFSYILISSVASDPREFYFSKNGKDHDNTCEQDDNPCFSLDHVFGVILKGSDDSGVVVNTLDSTSVLINKTITFSKPSLTSLSLLGTKGSTIIFKENGFLKIEAKVTSISNFGISSDTVKIDSPLLTADIIENCQFSGLTVSSASNDEKMIPTIKALQVRRSSFSSNKGQGINLLETKSTYRVQFRENIGFNTLLVGESDSASQIHLEDLVVERNIYEGSVAEFSTSGEIMLNEVLISNNRQSTPNIVSVLELTSQSNIFVNNTNISGICDIHGKDEKAECIVMASPRLWVTSSVFSLCKVSLSRISESAEFKYFKYTNSSEPFSADMDTLSLTLFQSRIERNQPNGGLKLTSFKTFVSEDTVYYGNVKEEKETHGGGVEIDLNPQFPQNVLFQGKSNLISGNSADHGGGMYLSGHVHKDTKIAFLAGSTSIYDNTANYGGGCFLNITFPPEPSSSMIKNDAKITMNTGNIMAGGVFVNMFGSLPFPLSQVIGQVSLNSAPVAQDVGGPPTSFSFLNREAQGKLVCSPYNNIITNDVNQKWLCNVDGIQLRDVFDNEVIVWRYFDIFFEYGNTVFRSFTHPFNGTCFLFTFLLDNQIFHSGELVLMVEGKKRESREVVVAYKGNGKKTPGNHGKNGYWANNYQYYIDGGAAVILCCVLMICCTCYVAMTFGCIRSFRELTKLHRKTRMQKLKKDAHFSMSINSSDNVSIGPNELDPLLPSLSEVEDEERKEVVMMFLETCDMIFNLGNKEKLGRVESVLGKIRVKAGEVIGKQFKKEEVTPCEIFKRLIVDGGGDEPTLKKRDYLRVMFTFPGNENMILDELESSEKDDNNDDGKDGDEDESKKKKSSWVQLKLDKFSNRVLHYACFFENEEYIQLLLDHGVSRRVKNSYGRKGRFPYQYLPEDNSMFKKVCFVK